MTGHTDPRIGRLPMGAGWRRRTWWPVAVVALVAVAAPALGDAVPFLPPASGWLFAATQALAMLALALTWGTIADVHGRVDLGHAVFVGVGAYTCGGALIALGWPAVASLIAGAAGAALLGGATGALLLRLPAPAFSLATFGLLLLTRELVRSATPLTRGPEGLALPVTLGQAAVYQGMLAACIAALALATALRHRRLKVGAGRIGQAAAYTCLTAVSGLVG
ncbi:MAG TPA: hypothetical protein VMM13_04395, partial [Euzebya sp.]|nr:hypothetical protein [Euzebya sp.]